MRIVLLLALSGLLTSCFHRNDDRSHDQDFPIRALGLSETRPALVVFGAGWCKPCRSEVRALNTISDRYQARVQVLGVLVEGETRGMRVDFDSIGTFRGLDGARPIYSLAADPDWMHFDSLKPAQGRALPLFALVRTGGRVASLVQRSVDLETELVPMLERLIAGGAVTAPPTPEPETAVRSPISAWRPQADPAVIANFEESWKRGLAEFSFQEHEMPFDNGIASVRPRGGLVKGEWSSDTGCQLTVIVDEAGRFVSATGICA